MENKRYLDKVIEHLVRGTKIDYDKEEIEFLSLFKQPFTSPIFISQILIYRHPYVFKEYCVNTFGLTDDEVSYVWEEYKKIIKEKINQ